MVQQIHVRELQPKLTAGEPVYLIDVREPWEHEAVAQGELDLKGIDKLAKSRT